MIENNLLSYLNFGLPEDVLRMKLHGDFDGAVRFTAANAGTCFRYATGGL